MEYAQVLDSEVVRVRKESPGFRMSSRLPAVLMVLVFAVGSCVSGTLASPPQSKWSGSDANINAIEHRRIALDPNFYSPEREKELGKSLSQEFERTSKVLNDPVITEYIARVAQNVAKNSDARKLITVRVVDSDAVNAVTLPAGYQYVTRGLLLRLENEAELASVLARGVAHTALRSATWIATKADIMQLATSVARPSTRSDSTTSALALMVPLAMPKMQREAELGADYFGVQYMCKAGYDPKYFTDFVQRLWGPTSMSGVSLSEDLSTFPPLEERLAALKKEISEILPPRANPIVSTPEFGAFKERLRPQKPEAPEQKRPAELTEPSDSIPTLKPN